MYSIKLSKTFEIATSRLMTICACLNNKHNYLDMILMLKLSFDVSTLKLYMVAISTIVLITSVTGYGKLVLMGSSGFPFNSQPSWLQMLTLEACPSIVTHTA